MKQELDFKQWVTNHNPKLNWNWNNPEKLMEQLANNIGETGSMDLKTIFDLMFTNNESGLTENQDSKFIKWSNQK